MAGDRGFDGSSGAFSSSGSFWLPPELLASEDDDVFMLAGRGTSPNDSSDEDREDEYLANLTREMTQFFLKDDAERAAAAAHGAMVRDASGTSPLCAMNYLPASAAKMDDPWSVLYDAADQIMLMRAQVQAVALARKEPQHHSPPASKAQFDQAAARRRQLQAAQFYALRQQQMAAAAWQKQSRARGDPTWAPIHHKPSAPPQQPQLGSGMRAMFLTGGTKKESAGTGVFLPRRPGAPSSDSRKKPGCSTVLLPARVVQALNLNIGELAAKPSVAHDLDDFADRNTRSKVPVLKERQAPATVCSAAELRLPQEWTY